MPLLFLLTLLSWIPGFLCWVNTTEQFALLEGRSLTVPCHYDSQYASYVKYWCRGKMREFCSSLGRTDDTHSANPAKDKVSILDDPVHLVFTVTMNDLKEEESGWYMCGVEIGGVWTADVVAFTNIKVIHGLSVVKSELIGEEGSGITVECLYSKRYRESEKKWCRSGDWSSCRLTDSEGSYDDASVAISDDRTGAFTVTLKKLQMRDTGWYLCSAGQKQEAVHVLVTPRASTTASVTISPSQDSAHLHQPKLFNKDSWHSRNHLESLLVCASLVVLAGLVVLARKFWKMHKENTALRQVNNLKARLSDYSGDVGDLQSTAVVFRNMNSQDVHMY
ncbi:polymeric immunoglobulin receptor isoform X2 [Channa argus]|uniref:polymeric immunoglobulin receptor isoform X2 n=1 Tax=Channa argus TaxID=215402 RepID=UPI003522D533